MNSRYFQRLVSAVFALGLGAILSAAAQAQPSTKSAAAQQLDERHAAAGVACSDCHGQGARTRDVTQETCVECHNRTKLVAKTANVRPLNPHANRHYGTEADCGLCHRQHEKSVNFCADCHPRFDFKVK